MFISFQFYVLEMYIHTENMTSVNSKNYQRTHDFFARLNDGLLEPAHSVRKDIRGGWQSMFDEHDENEPSTYPYRFFERWFMKVFDRERANRYEQANIGESMRLPPVDMSKYFPKPAPIPEPNVVNEEPKPPVIENNPLDKTRIIYKNKWIE